METILNYIDSLFRGYPDTESVQKAKTDLLNLMEDKYNELKADGKSENEAIGIVISEFGNMEEIAEDLGLTNPADPVQNAKEIRPEKRYSRSEAETYLQDQKSFGTAIAAGVALCILSPTAAAVLEPLSEAGILPEQITDTLGAVALFIMVAAAVGIFITKGIANSKYEKLKNYKLILDENTKQRLTEENQAFLPVFGRKIAIGVVLCIISVIPSILFSELSNPAFPEAVSDMISVLSLLACVAAGVFCFITAGVRKDAYDQLLNQKKYTKASAKSERIMEVVSRVYWCIITAVYLAWSLLTMQWGITWIIWPVSGVLFGAISVIIKFAAEEKAP